MKLNYIFNIASDLIIEDIYEDSRKKVKNGMFFAIKGLKINGNDYIEEAIKNGAVCIVTEENIKTSVLTIKVKNIKKVYNEILKKIYHYTSDKLKLISVTGTDGKTTVSEIIAQLLDDCGYIGTNGIRYKDLKIKNSYTTPMPDVLFKTIDEFYNHGCKYISMESSSERLGTNRLIGINFDVAIFTNLTRDHLDVHGTMENYALAKSLSFKYLKPTGLGIINYDDKYKDYFINSCANYITYSLENKNASIYASNINIKYNHLEFDINGIYGNHHIETSLSGKYNVYNLMCAIVTLRYFNYDMDTIIEKIKKLKPIESRQEYFKTNQGFDIMVDYSHTAGAIKNLTEYVRTFTKGRIIAVTGASGDRDVRRMIDIANFCTENLDCSIFTIDNPRYEDQQQLLHTMIKEVTKNNYETIIDRDEAIKKAISLAQKEDIILLLGKGNENYQIVNGKFEYRKTDMECAKEYLKENY